MSPAIAKRQRIIDTYLAASGRNQFSASEFIEWLEQHPEHEAYPIFFSISDGDAARAYRVEKVRQFISGLRLTITRQEIVGSDVRVIEHSVPMLHSPLDDRSRGGGYIATSDEKSHHIALAREGSMALRSWLERYAGAISLAGGNVSGVRECAASIDRMVANASQIDKAT